MFLRQAEHDVARVCRSIRGRNCDGNEDVVVSPIGRHRVRPWSSRHGAGYFACITINDTQCGIGSESARSIEIIVAGIVPDLISALGFCQSSDLLASETIDDHQWLSASATYEQVLSGAESQARAAYPSRIRRFNCWLLWIFEVEDHDLGGALRPRHGRQHAATFQVGIPHRLLEPSRIGKRKRA